MMVAHFSRRIATILCLAMSSSAWATAARSADEPDKPAHTTLNAYHRQDVINVKFQDGLTVRLRNGRLDDLGTGALDAPAAKQVLQNLLGGTWQRSHELPEADLEALRTNGARNTGNSLPDLNLEYLFFIPAGSPAAKVIDSLNALDCVEMAQPVPVPVRAPTPPNYQSFQGYLNLAPGGVSASAVWTWPGAAGTGVRIADLEYSWNVAHNDLPAVTRLGAVPNDPFDDTNHGTAVLGEIVSLQNGWGTTGVCYAATPYIVATNTGAGDGVWNIGAAITTALGTLRAGDVILIEQQMAGPNYFGVDQYGLVPIEWFRPWYNAILTAVANGVVVVEAAGNGSENLDSAVYNQGNGGHFPFQPARDSGAIIVGASASPGGSDVDRSRLWFSNYGSTLDLHAWGENVYTLAYGDLYSSEGVNRYYTRYFGGTSSASPIVAGSVALVQSVNHAVTGSFLTPAQVRTALRNTGSPQQAGLYPATQVIGPRPNVRAALISLLGGDCNANNIPDAQDILAGASDCNHNGVLDQCESPGCTADWNHTNCVNSQDFFDFLSGFFANAADFNHDGMTNSQDFFDFLVAFFAGC